VIHTPAAATQGPPWSTAYAWSAAGIAFVLGSVLIGGLLRVAHDAKDRIAATVGLAPTVAVQLLVLAAAAADMTAMSLPARDRDGKLVPPPHGHVLDHLARAHDLVPEIEALSRPAAPYSVECVTKLPDCDLCGHSGAARYYGHLLGADGPGLRLCPDCYGDRCGGRLGSATGELYLMLYDEVPQAVRDRCDRATASLGRPSIWASP
jgi:hypothetical protein